MKVLVYFIAIVSVGGSVNVLGEKETAETHFNAIGESEISNKRIPRNVLISKATRWPNNRVCYRFHPVWSHKHRALVRDAMDYIENHTYVRFVEDIRGRRRDCVSIIPVPAGSGCDSDIGYRGVPQTLMLPHMPVGSGCLQKFTIVHELLHTCGMYHQHSAHNRDKFITIKWNNIEPDLFHAFAKRLPKETTSFGLPYDYKSIMHYGPNISSKNGKDTIVTPNVEQIGQRMGMSEIDVKKMLAMYPKKNKSKYITEDLEYNET